MNSKNIILSLLVGFSFHTQAQQNVKTAEPPATPKAASVTPTTSSDYQTSTLAKGFRVEFLKSFLDGKVEDKYRSHSGKVYQNFSLGFGYANISDHAPGFLGRAIFTQHTSYSDSFRLDGNATYGVNDSIYFLGGLNLNKFLKGDAEKMDMGLGFQFGAGWQANPNFGVGLSYVFISNSMSSTAGSRVDFSAQGLELGVHGTF